MKLVLKRTLTENDPPVLVDFLAAHCELSKSTIKRTLTIGGCWLNRGDSGLKRCRKAKQLLSCGDRVEFYFDDNVINAPMAQPIALLERRDWGIWYKPANVVSQGSPYGDRGAMDNLVIDASGRKQVFLVHRLDREAAGIMVFAYTKQAAGKLSGVWSQGGVKKIYQAEVVNHPQVDEGQIDIPLDGKEAKTSFRVHSRNTQTNTALVNIRIHTGRLHQIRRHLASIGHPLIGDPKYGEGNKSSRGLQLVASEVHFEDPMGGGWVDCIVPRDLRIF